MAQNIKYADFNLATGANTGFSKTDAWKTIADVIAGEAANDRVRINNESSASTTTNAPTTNGTIGNLITWIAFDFATDTEVTLANWSRYGGTINSVTIDGTGAAAGQFGLEISNGHKYREFIGIKIINGFDRCWRLRGILSQVSLLMCEAENALNYGFNIVGTSTVRHCHATSCTSHGFYAANQDTCLYFCTAKDCTSGFYNLRRNARCCVAIGCDIGFRLGSIGSEAYECVAYDCTTAVQCAATSQLIPVDSMIVFECTNILDLAVGTLVYMKNVKYKTITAISIGAGSYIDEGGNELLTDDPMVDPANDNFTSVAAVTELVNLEEQITEDTIAYLQAGLTQEVVAGAKRRPRIRTHGV